MIPDVLQLNYNLLKETESDCCLPMLIICLSLSQALAMTEVNGPVGGPLVVEPQIAMFCGRPLLHINTETGQWEPDPQGRQGCFTQPNKILSYCQEMYPGLQISHVEEASAPVTIPAWCKKGWGHCQTRQFIVIPYRCLVGEYVSEALLVPDRCRFLHQEQMDSCESYVYWHNIAKEACTADSLELHSYGMLLPCGDRFRGVEYVCCPGRSGAGGRGETEGVDSAQGATPPLVSLDDSEHANFLRAKMDLEERRMKRINEIMKEWAEADNQSKNLPKSDRQALNEHFQAVLQTLEEQVAGERQRLVETHLARVVATLNNNRRLALESYLSAVQSDPPQPERVLQALKRYLAAEQKDRRHTLRHYQHIESADPQKAEQMKFQVYTHLHVIEERMNQSLALLYKVPTLAEELHDEIRTTRYSFSLSQTEKSVPPSTNAVTQLRHVWCLNFASLFLHWIYKINTSVELKQVVYKSSGIQRDELQPDVLETFNRGAMVGLLVVAVAIAMVMVISLLLVRRKPYGTISHGIVEVDPMLTPEERQLSKMQNHGYENPTYKFFEQMN
uniref:Amyloid beta (A4) precursor-like protein 1 n=1 Tax=Pygocentrus nattereri TaxID=42514 RepID=A0AAR2LVF8_PYGNA